MSAIDNAASVKEDAGRCINLWRAVVDLARRDATGKGLASRTEGVRRRRIESANEFLDAIGARR